MRRALRVVSTVVSVVGLAHAAANPRFAVDPPDRLRGLRSVWVRLACAPDGDCSAFADRGIGGLVDEVETRLRRAGLGVLAADAACPAKDCAALRVTLSVGKTPVLGACLWNAGLALDDGVTFVRGGEEVSAIASTWTWSTQGLAAGDACPAIAVRQALDGVDRFVEDYVAGNPRP